MFKAYKNKILAHAVEEAEKDTPLECLGVIFDGEYIRLKNVHEKPENHFRMSKKDMDKYVTSDKLEAIVHSHPTPPDEIENGEGPPPPAPSEHDMKTQQALAVPFIIVAKTGHGTWDYFHFGDHRLEEPLRDQEFRHGVIDCYEYIRKRRYQVYKEVLPQFPRDNGWWNGDQDLYMEGFQKAGYYRIYPDTPKDLVEEDVFLYKVGSSPVYNHGGVYEGGGLIGHHLPGRYSNQMPLGPWFRRVDVWLRKDPEV